MSFQETNRFSIFRLQKLFSLSLVLFLMVLSIISFDYVRGKVRDQKRKADLRQISQALNLYYDKYNKFPEVEDKDFSGWDTSIEQSGEPSSFLDVLYEEKLIDYVPQDPLNNDFHFYRYNKFPQGSFGCSRPFYVLQVVNFEEQELNHGSGGCPEMNFVDFAENGYTMQVFE